MLKSTMDPLKKKWCAFFGVTLFAFTAFLDTTIVFSAMPFIKQTFDAHMINLQWVANIYTIILCMTMLAVGKFADYFGKTRVFYFGALTFFIASIGCAVSPELWTLVFFRGLLALGASIFFITCSMLISDIFSQEHYVKAVSIYAGITGLGMMIGPFLGGIIVQLLGWRYIFWVNVPILVIGWVLNSTFLKVPFQREKELLIDWKSLLLLVFGLGLFVYGLTIGAWAKWESLLGWATLGLGVLFIILLVIIDSIVEQPFLDLEIFRSNLIVLAALSCSLAGVVSTVFMFYDPIYLHTIRGLPAFLVGLLVAAIPAGQAVISLFFTRLIKHVGISNILLLSITASFIAAGMHLFVTKTISVYYLIVPFLLMGINWGLSNSGMIIAVNDEISESQRSVAYGTLATLWNLSGTVILAISVAIFHTVHHDQDVFFEGYKSAVIFLAAFAALIFISAILARILGRKKQVPFR